MPETHTYSFNLPANSAIAIFCVGGSIGTVNVYRLNGGSLLYSVPNVTGGSTKYGVFTTRNISGAYTVTVYVCCGTYSVSCINGYQVLGNANTSYNRSNAANYAYDYYRDANPAYHEFSSDCTNFVSQAVHYGGMPMLSGGTTDNYWYYSSASNYSPTWTGVDFYLRHWSKVKQNQYAYNGRAYSVSIYTKDYILHNKPVLYDLISIGDTVHYLNTSTSQGTHSQIFQQKVSSTVIKTCSYSDGFYYGNWFDYIQDQTPYNRWVVVIKIRNT